jgi:hypothetical protein
LFCIQLQKRNKLIAYTSVSIAINQRFPEIYEEMSEDEGKPTREEGKRPQASLWMKNKKERGGNENIPRVPMAMFIAPPKTPVASKLRKDAQAKALAAEKVVAASESEMPEEQDSMEERETRIKRRKRRRRRRRRKKIGGKRPFYRPSCGSRTASNTRTRSCLWRIVTRRTVVWCQHSWGMPGGPRKGG